MALINTTITPTLWQQNLVGPGDNAREQSSIPRAQMVYGKTFDWPSGGAGNDRQLSIDIDLPTDYAYFLTDATLYVNQSAANAKMTAQSVGYLQQISDTGPGSDSVLYYQMFSRPAQAGVGISTSVTAGGVEIGYNQPMTSTDTGDNLNQAKVYNLVDRPKSLMFPYQDTRFGSAIRIRLWDSVDGAVAYTGNVSVTLLQYDITQAYNANVHTAALTR